jgi:uncharacterized protein YodC (DUF2158 family)
MFKIGDVVQLKSGGPTLTVVKAGDEVECIWYAEDGETFKRETLPAACLESIEFEDDEAGEDDDED